MTVAAVPSLVLTATISEEFTRFLRSPLGWGESAAQANAGQAFVRAVVVYGLAVVLVRLGNRRGMGRATLFDAILSVMLGSTLSRGINGGSYLLPALAASAALVGAHWTLAAITFRSPTLSRWVKGRELELLRNGEFQRETMDREHVTEGDILEELRQQGKLEDPAKVKVARLERSGQVSVLKREEPPKVVEVRVENGVQTVRIEVSSGG